LADTNLYDTVPAYYSKSSGSSANAVSSLHSLNDPSFPLHGQTEINIKADRYVPEEWKDKLVIQKTSGGTQLRKASWQNGWITASMGDFGNFQAFADIIPPSINSPGQGDI
jgi:hypothetical protein